MGVGWKVIGVVFTFLMYRVELKVIGGNSCPSAIASVPNVPCGVESKFPHRPPAHPPIIPFLMYRVELKVSYLGSLAVWLAGS